MTEPKKNPDTREKKEPKELRDLKPKQDVKGGKQGNARADKRPPQRTAEIDFMNWE